MPIIIDEYFDRIYNTSPRLELGEQTLNEVVKEHKLNPIMNWFIICDQAGIPNDEKIWLREGLEKYGEGIVKEYIINPKRNYIAVKFRDLFFDYLVTSFSKYEYAIKSTGQVRFKTLDEAMRKAKRLKSLFPEENIAIYYNPEVQPGKKVLIYLYSDKLGGAHEKTR